MHTVTIHELAEGLKQLADHEFDCEGVYDFLSGHQVTAESIEKYLFWSDNFYTRNLVYKDERFEMMIICWEKGQASRIHNHNDQKCWMMVPIGRLRGQNFAVVEMDAQRGYCKLSETNMFDLSDCLAAKVDLEEPVHQVINMPEFDERAASIHIYSKPYDKCLSYCRDTDTFKEVDLFYTSIDGKLCDGIEL